MLNKWLFGSDYLLVWVLFHWYELFQSVQPFARNYQDIHKKIWRWLSSDVNPYSTVNKSTACKIYSESPGNCHRAWACVTVFSQSSLFLNTFRLCTHLNYKSHKMVELPLRYMFRPKWAPKCRKNFLGILPPLTWGPRWPPPLIWRSGFPTDNYYSYYSYYTYYTYYRYLQQEFLIHLINSWP